MKPIYINGRYLTQQATGVQRFASEFVHALDEQMSSGALETKSAVYLVVPHGQFPLPRLKKIRLIQRGRFSGHAWEQQAFYLILVDPRHCYIRTRLPRCMMLRSMLCLVVTHGGFASGTNCSCGEAAILLD
jgi:hypothetical protein